MYVGLYPLRCREPEVEVDFLSEALKEAISSQEETLMKQGFVVVRRTMNNPSRQKEVKAIRALLFRGDIGVQIWASEMEERKPGVLVVSPLVKPQIFLGVESHFSDHLGFKTGSMPGSSQCRPPGDFVFLPNVDVETLIKNHLERKVKKGSHAIWFETADAYMDAVDAEAERDLAWQVKKGQMIKATHQQLEKLRAAGRI